MITQPLRSRIDKLWEEFWTGGITNPLDAQPAHYEERKRGFEETLDVEPRFHRSGIPIR